MEMSLFLAKVMGLYIVIIGITMLVNRKGFMIMLNAIMHDQAALFLSAIITLIIGILLVVSHNLWQANWTVVITVLAWLVFIKGIFRVLIPDAGLKLAKRFQQPAIYYPVGVIYFLLGIYLLYQGFIN